MDSDFWQVMNVSKCRVFLCFPVHIVRCVMQYSLRESENQFSVILEKAVNVMRNSREPNLEVAHHKLLH